MGTYDLDVLLNEAEQEDNSSPSQEGEEQEPVIEEPEVEKPKEVDEEPDNTPVAPKQEFDHPRFIALSRKIDEANRRAEEAERRAQEALQKTEVRPTQTDIPEWFKSVVGDDEEAWNAYESSQKQHEDTMYERFKQRQKEEQEAHDRQLNAAKAWASTQLDSLTEKHGLSESDRNEVVKIALDFGTRDTEGRHDLEAAYKIFEKFKAKPNTNVEAKKKAAAQSTVRAGQPSTGTDFMYSDDLKGLFNT